MEPGEENKKISLSILHEDTASKILTEVNCDSAKFEKSDGSGTAVGASQFDEWLISLFLVVDWFYSW